MGKILIIGASPDSWRKSYQAIGRLIHKNREVIAVGRRTDEPVFGIPVLPHIPPGEEVDTVLLYINPTHQPGYYQSIVDLKPRQLVFNPGTVNDELAELAQQAGIKVLHACALYRNNFV